MRVEIIDADRYSHIITSDNLELIGQWFSEVLPKLCVTSITRQFTQVIIWPTTPGEIEMVGQNYEIKPVTQAGILALTDHLLKVAQDIADKEMKDVDI